MHVSGLLRIDGIPKLNAQTFTPQRVMDVIGPMILPYFHLLRNPERAIIIPPSQGRYTTNPTIESTLPKGSEGSLQYRVIEYDTGLPWVSVPFWGDLRDVSETQSIARWFLDLCQRLHREHLLIRDGIMSVKLNDETPECYATRYENDMALSLVKYI